MNERGGIKMDMSETIRRLKEEFLLLDNYYPQGVALEVMERIVRLGKGQQAIECISEHMPVESTAHDIDLFIYECIHNFINYYEY